MSAYEVSNPALQLYRNISVKLIVLDYKFNAIDEIGGIVETISISNDSTSDIRRTISLSMILDSGYTNTGILNDMYFSAGNGFWFDKYIQIQIGVNDNYSKNIIYYPQGTYLLNTPSVTYNADTNSLSFDAIDLMAKLTGLRNGALHGVTYQVPVGSVITDVIRDTLIEQGFYKCILNTPEEPNTPYEIKIESGGTTYDLLTELRDINPNWEMFFDVDGTFVFQKIPSGQIGSTPNYTPSVVASDEEWEKLLIGYDLSTSFEDVKNYIEVYGKSIEATAEGAVDITNIDNGIITVTNTDTTITGDKIDFVMFTLGDTSQDYEVLSVPITTIIYIDSVGSNTVTCNPLIKYNNITYMMRVGNNYCEYLGYQQPCAIAWENNPSSPFYVGGFVLQSMYNFVDNANNSIITNNNDILSASIRGVKTQYYTPTDEIIDNTLFNNIVRYVCSGDEYDNIYSNQLAMDRAVYELYQRCRLHDTLTIQCVPIYSLDTNQMISITLPNEDEISFWLIKNISTDISVDGTQTITAMRYYAEYPSN